MKADREAVSLPTDATKHAGAEVKSKRNPLKTRRKLLEAAKHEFATKGLEGARVDRIADRAGSSKQLVYHYFESKDKLYTIVLEEAYGRIHKRENSISFDELEPEDAIASLVGLMFEQYLALREEIALIADENFHKARHIRGSAAIKSLHSHLVGELKSILDRGVRKGIFRAGIDPVLLLIALVGLGSIFVTNNFTLSAVLDRDLSNPREIKKWRAYITKFVLSAIRA